MKANGAPEKIYFSQTEDGRQYFTPAIPFEREFVEYVPVDAFIEKACDYIKEHLFDYWSQSVTDESKFVDGFRKYMKGE